MFEIYNADDLKHFAADINHGSNGIDACLMNDIDLNPGIDVKTKPNCGYRWPGIAHNYAPHPYSGCFDGLGHTIYGLYVTSAENQRGFCGINSGQIKNLTLDGLVSAREDVGGVVGINEPGSRIINCRSNLTIYGNNYVGGIVGCLNRMSEVINCENSGNIHITRFDFDNCKRNNYRVGQIAGFGWSDYCRNNKETGQVIIEDNNSVTGTFLRFYRSCYDGTRYEKFRELFKYDDNPEHLNELHQSYLHLICSCLRDRQTVPELVKIITDLAAGTNIDFAGKDIFGKSAIDYLKSSHNFSELKPAISLIKEHIKAQKQAKKEQEIDEEIDCFGF